ncbi:MAG: phage tail protein I [Magnetococcales bacterium]|nr:phage tail protein I [Magnetococcales bacterium]
MKTLLPANALPLERDLETATARVGDVAVPVKHLWNPQSCPVEILPWLAWALSVDFWEDSWPQARKRQVIADSILWHGKKGTIGAVKTMLATFGVEASVSEWFEYAGDPYTFRVEMTGGEPVTQESIDQAIRAIAASKNTRSHLEKIAVKRTYNGSFYRGMALRQGKTTKIHLRFSFSAIKTANNYAGSVMHKGRITAVHPVKPQITVNTAQSFSGAVMHRARTTTIGANI